MNKIDENTVKKPSYGKQRADQLLVIRGFFESRARAQAAIIAGLVHVDGQLVRKPSQEIAIRSSITAASEHPFVSRGGLKLAHALLTFGIPAEGKICLDVGASTGGFSDVLIRHGAKHVYAVDTGRNQLHESLRHNQKITLMEGQDIRKLNTGKLDTGKLECLPLWYQITSHSIELTVIDVSFISLKLILSSALKFSAPDAQMIALIKPQFEVGKANIGKGGIVKDETLYEDVFKAVILELGNLGWEQNGVIVESPVRGGDGNREFLMAAKKT